MSVERLQSIVTVKSFKTLSPVVYCEHQEGMESIAP